MDDENRMVHLAIAVEGQIDIQVAIAQAHLDILCILTTGKIAAIAS